MKQKIIALLLCLVTVLGCLPVTAFAESAPVILEEPSDCYGAVGETVSTKVVAEGEDLSYQWYYRNKNNSKFKKAKYTTPTYSAVLSDLRDGCKIYCVVTDGKGNSVKSKTVTLQIAKPKITQQPSDCYGALGEEVSTSVAAEGEGLSYQWYYRNKNNSKFKKAKYTTPTYSAVLSDLRDGCKIYCVVTNRDGYSVKSQTVTLNIPKYAAITTQPKSARAAFGKKVTVTVAATGDGLSYQWYKRDVGQEEFTPATIKTAKYSVKMTQERSGRSIYCVITDRYGNSVQTDTVRILATGSFKADKYTLAVGGEKDLAQQLAFTADEPLQWESSNPEVAEVSGDGLVKGLKRGSATVTVTGTVTGVKAKCKLQVGKLKQVALTFDDGPSGHTARLLDHLEGKNAKVTFFMVGNRMNSYKKTVKRIAEQGHELGYHSYSHSTQTNLSNAQIQKEYSTSSRILKDLTGEKFTLWRTPGGGYNSRVLGNVPLPHILWSVDTLDWKYRNSTTVYNAIINHASDGAIILLHDLHGTTVDGAIKAIDWLLANGYELVTVTELLSRDGTPPKNGVTYYSGK